ncbi:RrF2 family transcriptional regulator [Amycolatopsis anabasis]|uniref:RrF2 family transcriptional regulator n=1 Tax=Amycolatopsis anabasis TaxID=1840409 RepID=UPI00131EB29A|nr:Rrf2 family transcriptional regulator [Amycolatopsis anabasis]
MKLSNGIEWVLHCCVTLSQAQDPVPAQRLAELHDIPPAYLAKHLQALSRAGVVHSSQGQDGGYGLTRSPQEISVLDVVVAIDGSGEFFRCTEIRKRGPLATTPERCTTRCSIARAMANAELAWREALSKITIADLAANIDADSGGTALGDVREWLKAH